MGGMQYMGRKVADWFDEGLGAVDDQRYSVFNSSEGWDNRFEAWEYATGVKYVEMMGRKKYNTTQDLQEHTSLDVSCCGMGDND